VGRGRESGILEQLAETVRRLFGHIPTREVDVSLVCAPAGETPLHPLTASSAVEHSAATPRLRGVPPLATTTVAPDTSLAAHSSDAGALATSSVTVVDAMLARLASPRVASVSPRPTTVHSAPWRTATPVAVVRERPMGPARAKCRNTPVPRMRATSAPVIAPRSPVSSFEKTARAAELPVRRRRMPLRTAAARARAYRAILHQTGLQPKAVDLIGVFDRVPAAQPERVDVIADGNVLLLWYPVGVRSSDAAPLAVVRSRADGRLYAAFLSSDDQAEGGSQQRQ